MKRRLWIILIALVIPLQTGTEVLAEAITFGAGANQFAMEFVPIGDPGNPADTTGRPKLAGSVPYVYAMGKYEVSRGMIAKASTLGNLKLTMVPMDYPVDLHPHPDMPATGLNWNEAARFVNWLNTSQGYTPAYKFRKQPGETGYDPSEDILLWQAGDLGYNPANQFRNSLAHFFLPSVDEWYKAAYYDPRANAGAGGYWDYPTGSDEPPTPVASGTAAGTTVHLLFFEKGPADITQAGGLSPYGVMGLGGNVTERLENDEDFVNDNPASFRTARGGSYASPTISLSAMDGGDHSVPSIEQIYDIGFRVASIPEPGSLVLGALGAIGLLVHRRHVRHS